MLPHAKAFPDTVPFLATKKTHSELHGKHAGEELSVPDAVVRPPTAQELQEKSCVRMTNSQEWRSETLCHRIVQQMHGGWGIQSEREEEWRGVIGTLRHASNAAHVFIVCGVCLLPAPSAHQSIKCVVTLNVSFVEKGGQIRFRLLVLGAGSSPWMGW